MSDNLTGQTIRGYELRGLIGRGGFGQVYRAFQPIVGRDVAIKVILPTYANQPEFIRRFETEAQMVARLEHPFIIPLYDYWRDPSGAYLVMRWLSGGSLADKIAADGALSPETTLRILEAIAAALAHAHHSGVIHRDLKPDNILLDSEGNPYLADFGIATTSNADSQEMSAQTLAGSPAYIAPEQIKSQTVTAQADIYSLGMMLYEMLAGQKPFPTASTFSSLINSQLNEPLPPLYDIRPDLPDALDTVLQTATAKEPTDRYADVAALMKDFRAAVGSGTPQAVPVAAPVIDETQFVDLENPYKGLRAFQEADATDFFGRSALVEQLVSRLASGGPLSRFLAVIGPSGSGKSSAVKAGVIPSIRHGSLPGSDDWFVAEMTPGAQPFEHLANALMQVAVNHLPDLMTLLTKNETGLRDAIKGLVPEDWNTELLLVIDQFEEVFTLVDSEAVRAHFLNSLRVAVTDPASRVRIIVTLRADFVDRPLQYVEFGELIRQRNEFVLPLSTSELTEAIVAPARGVGAEVEEELIATICKEVGDQPGTLPLLQYALTELFEHRVGRKLTLAAYRDSGGVLGALARRAEETYKELDKPAQEATRQLFLRLVTLGEGTEDTRRRVKQSEFVGIGGDQKILNGVIDTYVKYRLLTVDRDPATRGPTLEVAHEALIRTWQRLRDWLDASREDLRIQRRLMAAALEWLNGNHETSFLASGTRLDHYEVWAKETSLALGTDEKTYLDASIVERSKQQALENERKAREAKTARLARNFQRVTIVLGVVGILAVLALIAAASEAITAQNQVVQANLVISTAHTEVAIIQTTLTPAQQNLDKANGAVSTAQTQIANAALTLTPAQQRLDSANKQVMAAQTQIAISGLTLTPAQQNLDKANGAVSMAQTQIALIGRTLTPVQSTLGAANTQVVQAGVTLTAVSISAQVQTNNVYAFNRAAEAQSILTTNGDPQLAALLSIDGLKRTYSEQADSELGNALALKPEVRVYSSTLNLTSMTVSHDGKRIANGTTEGSILLWDVKTGLLLKTLSTDQQSINDVAFSPDDSLLAAGSENGTVMIWDMKSDKPIKTLTPTPADGIASVLWSPDGKTIAAGGDTQGIIFWNVDSEKQIGQASGPEASNDQPTTITGSSPDGKHILTITGNAATLVNVADGAVLVTYQLTDSEVTAADLSPDGKQVLTGSSDGKVDLWDAASAKIIHTFSADQQRINDVAFSSDGQSVVAGGDDNAAYVWSIKTGALLNSLTRHNWSVAEVAFMPDNQSVVTTSIDGNVRIWALAPSDNRLWKGHTDVVNQIAITHHPVNGKMLVATAAQNGEVFLRDLNTGAVLHKFSGVSGLQWTMEFSPDDSSLLCAGDNGIVLLWDVQKQGAPVALTDGKTTDSLTAFFTPDGSGIIIGDTQDATKGIQILDVKTHQPTLTIKTISTEAIISPDGRYILANTDNTTATLFDVKTGTALHAFKNADGTIATMQFAPNSDQVLISGGNSATTWDVKTYQVVHSFTGHFAHVNSAVFSPDGKQILTASDDNTAKIWNATTGALIRTLSSNTPILIAVYSADSKTIFTGGQDKAVRVWDISYQDFITYACSTLTRDFTDTEHQHYAIPAGSTCPPTP